MNAALTSPARPGALATGDWGVSCLMVTRGRRAQPLMAAAAFQRQSHPRRELLVVDDNPDRDLADALAALDDPRIRVVRPARRGLTLGALRNLAVAEARHALVCTWDDDDLHTPERLEAQVTALASTGAQACVLSRLTVWWPHRRRLAISESRPWEPSLLCDRSVLPPFPDLDRGEDFPVVQQVLRDVGTAHVDLCSLYVYVVHGSNTWSAPHFEDIWRKADETFEGGAYAAALDRLSTFLPMAEYARDLPLLPLRGWRTGVGFTLARKPAPPATPRARPPPSFLFLQVNKRCNLRCQHCDFWKLDDDDRPNYLPWDAKRGLITEFARLNPRGSVVICGGESMLDIDEYFALCAAARADGVKTLSVINGTRVRDARMAERMVREGPDEVSVSLNSHEPILHDETRGVAGAFDKAVRALRLLLDARRRLRTAGPRIHVMGLVFDRNYRNLEAFYDFVLNDVGADKLKLNFLQPSFGHADEADSFFAEHGQVDPDALVAEIEACEARFRLNLNPVWRRQVHMYFRSLAQGVDLHRGWSAPSQTLEHICSTYERNIMVDHYGVARLCFSSAFPAGGWKRPAT